MQHSLYTSLNCYFYCRVQYVLYCILSLFGGGPSFRGERRRDRQIILVAGYPSIHTRNRDIILLQKEYPQGDNVLKEEICKVKMKSFPTKPCSSESTNFLPILVHSSCWIFNIKSRHTVMNAWNSMNRKYFIIWWLKNYIILQPLVVVLRNMVYLYMKAILYNTLQWMSYGKCDHEWVFSSKSIVFLVLWNNKAQEPCGIVDDDGGSSVGTLINHKILLNPSLFVLSSHKSPSSSPRIKPGCTA